MDGAATRSLSPVAPALAGGPVGLGEQTAGGVPHAQAPVLGAGEGLGPADYLATGPGPCLTRLPLMLLSVL